jgi:N-acetylmuramoyl-L-alanine amidase
MTYPLRLGTAALVALSVLLSDSALHLVRSETAPAPAPKPTPAPAPKPAPSQCNTATFRVVVDVGHDAVKYGAKSARGALEYDFNLRLAKVVEKALLDAGFARTFLMVTTVAPRAGLFLRAAKANSMGADLLLSIHHDSVPDKLLEKWEYEGEQLSFSDRWKGHSIFISNGNGDYKGSLQFGKLLGLQMKARGLKYTPHYTEKIMGSRRRVLVDADAGVYRYDELIVLKDTRMPAVLLEAGSIINREEELLLGTPEHQALIGASVADAVKAFCTARAAREPASAQPKGATTPAAAPASPKSASPWPKWRNPFAQ